jgi:hypothetical protein
MRSWQIGPGQTVEAALSGYRGGKVGLRTADGREQWVALGAMAKADRQAVLQVHAAGNAALEFRTWADATGSFRTEAALVAAGETEVELLKPTGDLVVVPLSRLDPPSREYAARFREPAAP